MLKAERLPSCLAYMPEEVAAALDFAQEVDMSLFAIKAVVCLANEYPIEEYMPDALLMCDHDPLTS